MTIETPKKKPPLEVFAEKPSATRDAAVELAVFQSNATPVEAPEVQRYVADAMALGKEPERSTRLASGRTLAAVASATIVNNAIRIVEHAERLVRERLTQAWAEETSPRAAGHALTAEIFQTLMNQDRLRALHDRRLDRNNVMSRESAKSYERIKKRVEYYLPSLRNESADRREVGELVQHWNHVHMPVGTAFRDIPGRDIRGERERARAMIRGQEATLALPDATKALIARLSDAEKNVLAEYLGSRGRLGTRWGGHRRRLTRQIPEINLILEKINLREAMKRKQGRELDAPTRPPATPRPTEPTSPPRIEPPATPPAIEGPRGGESEGDRLLREMEERMKRMRGE